MTQYVVVADWSRTLEVTETVPPQIKKSKEYRRGDVIDLDPDVDLDAIDIERLTVEPHAALVEKSVYDARNKLAEAQFAALAAARAATLTGPAASNPVVAVTEGYPEGERVDTPATTVGSGGTDPEPQGLVGEAGGDDYDDSDAWSYTDLQSAARARGLSAGGARGDLVNRLRGYDRTSQAPLAVSAANGELDDDHPEVALRNDDTNV